jgi:X-Pro dipeptidyl-peptidase
MRPRSRTLAAVLAVAAAAALAGCLGAVPDDLDASSGDDGPGPVPDDPARNLSPARFGEITYREIHVRTRDDVEIDVDVWHPEAADPGPDGSGWDAPVILVYSPYNELTKSQTHPNDRPAFGFHAWLVDHFTERGYAVALADARGTRESGGCMDVAGPKEVAAGAQVVERLADATWSNGKVGMFGVSYPARTQLGIAPLDPAGLETIVPVAGISNYYSYFYYDGVPREGNNPGTYAGYSAISLVPHPSRDGVTNYPGRETCAPEKFEHGLDLSGQWDTYWSERNYNDDVDQVTASMWFVHGFEDYNVVIPSALEYYQGVDAEKQAWLLQMEHNYPDDNSHEPAWSRQDFREELHAWYDAELMGRDTGVHDEAPVEVQDSSGRWRTADTWPPEETQTRVFELSADGDLLSPEANVTDGSRTYAATREGGEDLPDGEPAKLVYESRPLDEDLHFAGAPELHLNLSMPGRSTHVAWHLEAVSPTGDATLLTRGYLDTLYRDGVRKGPDPSQPGTVLPISLDAYPQDDVVPTGHKVRLTVSGDDAYTFADHRPDAASAVTVQHSGIVGSELHLPAVDPPEDAFFEPPMGEPGE